MTEQDYMDQDEYRVGCWNGSVEDGVVTIRHDSMEEAVEMDVEELGDLEYLVVVLKSKDKILNGSRDITVEGFDRLCRNLEA